MYNKEKSSGGNAMHKKTATWIHKVLHTLEFVIDIIATR